MVATDAISEGYNLHRAGTIFNFDIPYNPTRVIQRVGRINRINKKVFAQLFIYNYFPSDIGEKETRTKEISTLKMQMIHNILGEDTQTLTADETPQAFFEKQFNEIQRQWDSEKNWDADYRAFYDTVKNTEDMAEARKIPHRTRIRRIGKENAVLQFAKSGDNYIFKHSSYAISTEAAIKLFEATKDEQGYEFSDNGWKLYNNIPDEETWMKETKTVPLTKKDKPSKADLNLKVSDKLELIRRDLDAEEYYQDLKYMLNNGAIDEYSMREIDKLAKQDYAKIYDIIPPQLAKKCRHTEEHGNTKNAAVILLQEFYNGK